MYPLDSEPEGLSVLILQPGYPAMADRQKFTLRSQKLHEIVTNA